MQSTPPGDLNKPHNRRKVDALAAKIRRRQITGSRDIALQTAKLIREVVANARFANYEQLQDYIKFVGNSLMENGRTDHIITNTTSRILTLISEEYVTAYGNAKKSAGLDPVSVPPTPALAPVQSDAYFESLPLASVSPAGRVLPSSNPPVPPLPSTPTSAAKAETHQSASSIQSSTFFALLGHRKPIGGIPLGSPAQTQFPTHSSSASNLSRQSSPGTPLAATPTPHNVTLTPLTSSTFNLAHAIKSSQQPSTHLAAELFQTDPTQNNPTDSNFAVAFSKKSQSLKPVFIDAIQEFIEEIEGTHKNVAEQALDHIHSGEFILTIGHSRTIVEFLKAAARKRKFTVIVAETAPSFSGRTIATTLSEAGITTILIPDNNIFAFLPRCSKVLLGPHLVMADGSAFCISGALPLCYAASKLHVPVVICGGTFKFCPLYPGEEDLILTDIGNPDEVLDPVFLEKHGLEWSAIQVSNPYCDVIKADLISLYITNLGAHPASLLYRLLGDMYKPSSLE